MKSVYSNFLLQWALNPTCFLPSAGPAPGLLREPARPAGLALLQGHQRVRRQCALSRADGHVAQGARPPAPGEPQGKEKSWYPNTTRQNEVCSEVWKLLSLSSTYVPALLPCVMLLIQDGGREKNQLIKTTVQLILSLCRLMNRNPLASPPRMAPQKFEGGSKPASQPRVWFESENGKPAPFLPKGAIRKGRPR